jgi:hypothetical protein
VTVEHGGELLALERVGKWSTACESNGADLRT